MSNVESIYDGRLGGRAALGAPEADGRKASPARWARPLLITLSVVCGLVLLGRFVGEPLTTIHHVLVHSDVPLSEDQVLSLGGIPAGAHWYSVSETDIEKHLESSPLVHRALVQRVFPDTIRMTVWARQPAALVLASMDGRSLPVLVDGDGVVYKVGTSGTDLDLPVVSGLSAGDVSLGTQLPRVYGALFSDLRALRDKAPALYGALSEVRIAPSAGAPVGTSAGSGAAVRPTSPQELELLVYLTTARIPIRTRGSLDEGFVKYALMVVDLLSRQGVLKDIQELDFRNGDAVYRTASGATAAGAVAAQGG